MTREEQIATTRTLTDVSPEDPAVGVYLNLAGEAVLQKAFPYREDKREVPGRYHMLQCEIAAYLLNRRGAEGETAHSENGTSRQYESAGIPDSLMNRITPCAGVIL